MCLIILLPCAWHLAVFSRHHLMLIDLWSRHYYCPHSTEEAEAQRSSALARCHTAQKRQNWNLIHAARESRVLCFSPKRLLPCKGRVNSAPSKRSRSQWFDLHLRKNQEATLAQRRWLIGKKKKSHLSSGLDSLFQINWNLSFLKIMACILPRWF